MFLEQRVIILLAWTVFCGKQIENGVYELIREIEIGLFELLEYWNLYEPLKFINTLQDVTRGFR